MLETTFTSNGVTCAAWHFLGTGDGYRTEAGRPCLVMAHGFGGTRDTGLRAYAEGFAEAGIDVLLFDYRGFGDSHGVPRQLVSFRRQRADYHAAIAAARQLPGVDPDRIVLWGTSYSGGHVLPVAARDGRLAGAISLTPAMDGLAALVAIARHGGPRRLARLVRHGLIDLVRSMFGHSPHLMPIVGLPGTLGMITAPGAIEGYQSLAGPSWRNEVTARTALEVAFNRPTRFASRVHCPLLVQIGDHDVVAPPAAAHRAAGRAGSRAEVHSYPVDHFDVYEGRWQKQALDDQLAFLDAHLAVRSVAHPQKRS
jgi:pimeloyl-ACP methyl ester carboxylesterase